MGDVCRDDDIRVVDRRRLSTRLGLVERAKGSGRLALAEDEALNHTATASKRDFGVAADDFEVLLACRTKPSGKIA